MFKRNPAFAFLAALIVPPVAALTIAATFTAGVVGITALTSTPAQASISCAPLVPWFCKTKKPTR